jgi:hypothetical protein
MAHIRTIVGADSNDLLVGTPYFDRDLLVRAPYFGFRELAYSLGPHILTVTCLSEPHILAMTCSLGPHILA